MSTSLNVDNPRHKEQLRRLFRVTRTLLTMMKDRGYSLDNVSFFPPREAGGALFQSHINASWIIRPEITFENFLQYREQTRLFQNRQEFSAVFYIFTGDMQYVTEMTKVFFLTNEPGKAVSKDNALVLFHDIDSYEKGAFSPKYIVISEEKLTPGVKKTIQTTNLNGRSIEEFRDVEFAFNRTKHALAPIELQYAKGKDAEKVAAEEEIDHRKVPFILNTDPISKWYGAKAGDLFVTEIMGTTTDTEGYYRLVRTYQEKKQSVKKVPTTTKK